MMNASFLRASLFTSVLMHGVRKEVEGLILYPDGTANAVETTIS